MFESISNKQGLGFLEAKTPADLAQQIKSIHLPIKIYSIYFDGKNHVCFFDSGTPIIIRKKASGKTSKKNI